MKRLLTALLLLFVTTAFGQGKQKTHDYKTVDPAAWVIPNSGGVSYSLDSYKGSKALIIKKNFGDSKFGSVAYPKDLKFKDGVIEMDLASSNGQEFLGLAFRIKDAHHYQCLYFRPASTGTINAVQYMPEKKQEFNWWDYEAEKYQAKATLPATNWFHVKAEVKGQTLTVYIDQQPKPVMVYKALDPELKEGSVGYWFGNSSSCAYKNLTVKTY